MERSIISHILVALILTLTATSAIASDSDYDYDFKVDGICYNFTGDQSVSISSCANLNIRSVTIPTNVTYNDKTYSVTSIGDLAFCECEYLTSVTIPDSIIKIGNYAFAGCKRLTSVTISNSVIEIGNGAFRDCIRLTSVSIPDSVTEIGSDAFYDTPFYNNQANGVVYLGRVLYRYEGDMPENTSIDIKEGTVTISYMAFSDCTGLTSVTIPNSVTKISGYAFYGCSGLTSVTIPDSVTEIGVSAFSSCSGLKAVTIPNSVTDISGDAFNDTPFYNNQPNGLVYFGRVLYRYKGHMTRSTSIEIKEGTVAICDCAFLNCRGLTSVTIPASTTKIGNQAFYGTRFFDKQPNGLVYVGNVLYQYKGEMPQNSSIKIKEGTVAISDFAFSGCYGLTSVTIPNTVTTIGKYAFINCDNLTTINIPESVTFIDKTAFENTPYEGILPK